jgi:hypothetical protein
MDARIRLAAVWLACLGSGPRFAGRLERASWPVTRVHFPLQPRAPQTAQDGGVAMVRSGLEVIGAQADMAASLRTTVESLQVLTWAGVSMGEIEQATKKLTTRLSEAAAGSGTAVGALRRW